MLLLPVFLATPASAGDLGATLREAIALHGGAELAATCAPVSELFARLAGSSSLDEAKLPPGLVELLSGVGAAPGLRLDGPLSLGLSTEARSGWLSLPFSGSVAEAEALMVRVGLDPELASDGLWMARHGKVAAKLSDGALHLIVGSPLEIGGPSEGLLEGLPVDGGCAMWLAVPSEIPGARKIGLTQASAFLPLRRGQEALLRLDLDAEAPAALTAPAAAPAGGSSAEPPSLVMTVGVSPGALLEDPIVAAAMDLDSAGARRAARALDIGPGTTLAVFGEPDPDQLDWVAVLPTERRGRPASIARHARKALRRLDLEVKRTSSTAFAALREGHTIYGATAVGRLVVGADPVHVSEAAGGVGTSWLEGARLDRLSDWTVTVWTGPALSEIAGFPAGTRADLGLRSRDGVWELGLRAEGGLDLIDALLGKGAGGALERLSPGTR